MFHSLRVRLLIAFLAIIVFGVGGVTLWAGIQMAQATYSDYGSSIQARAVQLASELVEPLEENQAAQAVKVMTYTADNLAGKVVLFGQDGQYIGSTDGISAELVANDGYIYQRAADGSSYIYASAPINYEGSVLGIVQISTLDTIPANTARQRTLGLVASFVIVSIIGVGIALWLSSSMTRPLSDLRSTALAMSQGDLATRVGTVGDDEIGEVSSAFNQMAERVEAMVNEQRAFASNASHELRTPLTTIRLRTEALQDFQDDPELTALYIAEIDSEAKRMSSLVDDLLLLSRLDAKRLMAGTETIDVVRLMQVLKREFGRKADAKQIDLTISIPDNLVAPVTAHQSHLRVVFGNVIGNAIKYTQDGGSVSVLLQQLQDNIQLTVTDNGPGIAADDLPNIGKRFFRADKAHSREIAGTGLGLALVRSILELYRGDFHIESDGLGQGTCVTIAWPTT